MTRLALLAAPLALAACLSTTASDDAVPSGPAIPSGEADTCNAAQFAGLVGQPESAVDAAPIFQPIRKIRPGMPVTADFSANRINFNLNDSGIVVSIRCG